MKYILFILLFTSCTPQDRCGFENEQGAFWGLPPIKCGSYPLPARSPIPSNKIKKRIGPQHRHRTY